MYQGISRGDLRAVVDDLHTRMIGIEPGLTFLIDIDPALGLSRALARDGSEQRFEDMGVAMQSRMRDGFLALATLPRFRIIDGARDPAVVAQDVLKSALAHLGG
jgi:dTMP kinase